MSIDIPVMTLVELSIPAYNDEYDQIEYEHLLFLSSPTKYDVLTVLQEKLRIYAQGGDSSRAYENYLMTMERYNIINAMEWEYLNTNISSSSLQYVRFDKLDTSEAVIWSARDLYTGTGLKG